VGAVFYYDPVYTDGLSPEARFPRTRYRGVREELAQRGVDRRARIAPSPWVDRRDLLTVHTSDYVDAFTEGRIEDKVARRIGLRPWTDRIVERTFKIIGASVAATHALFDGTVSIAGNLPGGTHHAFADAGAGYCVFNDIAVAARVAQRDHNIQRVLVIDLDVHQGDGTAAIFADDRDVYTFSLHCAENFPFRKQTSDFDVALPQGTGDGPYLDALETVLPGLFEHHEPEMVIYQAGVDPLTEDHLVRFKISRSGLQQRNAMVYAQVRSHRVPTLVLMGGGYARPIEHSVQALADVFEQAIDGGE